ncbi:MAG TPA: DsbA family oxidoreductase [Casimicrobiaceae bacterium]|nr:DsbA family oxidoreductase [Casimicrobiaceae bacterium]
MPAIEADTVRSRDAVVIDVVSDVVCPWCYVGKRKLEAALGELGRQDSAAKASVRWHPFQLNPDLPPQGIPRKTYLHAKFGGARGSGAAEIYARVKAVGAEVGIAFEFDRIEIQPNTLAAHRLIGWAQERADAALTSDLVERLFRAYFVQGRAIGEPDELAQIASEAGLELAAARAMLASTENLAAVSAEDREARDVGINGVPFFIFNGSTALSGAQDPETLLQAIAAARSQST